MTGVAGFNRLATGSSGRVTFDAGVRVVLLMKGARATMLG